jgi:hypothetical protein
VGRLNDEEFSFEIELPREEVSSGRLSEEVVGGALRRELWFPKNVTPLPPKKSCLNTSSSASAPHLNSSTLQLDRATRRPVAMIGGGKRRERESQLILSIAPLGRV